MKQFLLVVKFELETLIKKKSFITSVLLVAVSAFILLSIPRFLNTDKDETETSDGTNITENVDGSDIQKDKTMLIYDGANVSGIEELAEQAFSEYDVTLTSDVESVKKAIEDGSANAGFEIKEPLKFVYYVKNSSLHDSMANQFQVFLQQIYQANAFSEMNYDVAAINTIYQATATHETTVLGTDGMNNYFYTYVLIMVLYMMILIYGNQIGVSVASEKSNRAIEILSTSCSPNAMIFGKVIAGAIAGVVQTALIIGSCLLAYWINADVWNHMLDPFLNIPSTVLLTFALFGVFGYLLFSFLFGAIGALCSKVEEVNGATMPIQLLIVGVFILSYVTLQMPNTLLATITCYVPFTSWMCMFINVAVGSVSWIEIIISFAILVVTTIAIGMIGAKLYRQGTLSYGNSMKLKQLIKMAKQKD